MNRITNPMIPKSSRRLTRAIGGLAVAFVSIGALAAVPDSASAFVPSVTAQCGTNVIDLSTPSAGQSYTYLKIWRWTGSEWSSIHTEMQRHYSQSGIVLDTFKPVNLPSGYVTARVWGWYPGSGWILLDTPLFRNGAGILSTPYCRV